MPKRKAKFVEFCGGTTAECAAVCCCFPFGIANLLVLLVYKVPAGLLRRAIRRRRWRKLQKKWRDHSELMRIKSLGINEDIFLGINEVREDDEKALLELEEEMWEKFNGTGFWRSPSQREKETGSCSSMTNLKMARV